MSDCIATNRAETEWRDRLAAGTIVSFRFPVAEEEGPPAKARPCLVIDVIDIEGLRHAVVAYGTTRQTRTNCGYEVEVRKTDARAAAGLDRRTRFVGARRVTVPLDDPAFVACRQRDTPILGRLAGRELTRLETLRTRFGPDLAAAILPPEDRQPSRVAPDASKRRRRTWPWLSAGRRSDRAHGLVHSVQAIPA